MKDIAARALGIWGLQGATPQLIAARENAVYRVDHGGQSVALRVHRLGYRSDAQLRAELDWMAIFQGTALSVPRPLAAKDGAYLHHVDGHQVDVLGWLGGAPLRTLEERLSDAQLCDVFQRLGHDMALLHQLSDAWHRPDGFERAAWDRDGLLGETPLWGRFWDNPALDPDAQALLRHFRDQAARDLARLGPALDYGLIHADLVSANVMVEGDALHLIDFDDGGFGFRIFDVTTALLKFTDHRCYPDLKAALSQGYLSQRGLDLQAFDLFMALRAATYVGWNIARMEEPDGQARNARFIATACRMAHRYLSD